MPPERARRSRTRARGRAPAHPWHPRFWPTHLLVGLMRLLALLPTPALRELGQGLGAAGMQLAGRRRRIAERNLALCFPELEPAARRRLLRAHLRAAGISLLEIPLAWFRAPDTLANRFELIGLEHLRAAQADGHGVILAGCHFMTLELCGALLSSRVQLDAMYRAHRNPVFDRVQLNGRRRRYGRLYERRDIRGAVRALRRGRVLWYSADQDHGARNAVFVPFFGVPAATLTTTARLARLGRARVLRVDGWRDDARMCWTVRIAPQLSGFPSGDDARDTARLSAAVEAAAREHPEQYLWLHRRFKTRPPTATGERAPDPYA